MFVRHPYPSLSVKLRILLVVIPWTTFFASTFEEGFPAARPARVRIAGYWPDYRPLDHLNHSVALLSDLILFSLELREDGGVGINDGGSPCCLRPEHYERSRRAKKSFAPDLNLWISIGGAGRTHYWEQVCKDPIKRDRFIESVVDLCRQEQIQGVSIDWFSAMSTSREIRLFSQCLKHASQRWRIHRNNNNNNSLPPLKISLSYFPMQTHPNDIFSWVDRIQVMTYGSSRSPPSSSSLPYHQQSDQMVLLAQQTTEQAVQALIHEAHCPPDKIWLGVPLYAQAMMMTTTTTTRKNKPPIMTFSDAMASYSSRGVEDDDKDDRDDDITHHYRIQQYLHVVLEGYQWESLEIMTMKRDLVHKYSLGGLFVWELGQDATDLTVPGNGGGEVVFPGGVALTLLSHLCSAPTTTPTSAPLRTAKLGQDLTNHDDDDDDDDDDTKESRKNEL